MKIAIDLTQIPANKTGMGIYALNLVRRIIQLNNNSKKFNFYFFLQNDDHEFIELVRGADGLYAEALLESASTSRSHGNLHKKNENSYAIKLIKDKERCHLIPLNAKIFRKLPIRFFFEQVLLPLKCKKLKIDAIYSFHYTMPYLTRCKRIVTIPDMTFYLFPKLHQKIKRLYFKALIPLSLKKSHKIVTISESTKKDLLKQFKHIKPGKVEVIHLGVNMAPPPERAAEHLEKYGLEEKKYFLFVGTLEPRKNIDGIIKAFHQVIQSNNSYRKNYKLVIAGGKGWFYEKIFSTVKQLHLEESVIFTGYVEGEVKESLLANAYLFIYPSFYEGFGLPVLEAMAYGVPVITGNVSSLPEVTGDAGLLICPDKWQEMAEAMMTLLSDNQLYEKLAEKSLVQAKKFSWKNTGEKTMALFESITSGNQWE